MGQKQQLLGQRGEEHVVSLLRAKGLAVLARNVRYYQQGEIDIIFLHDGVLVCLEVKTRLAETVPYEEQISRHKQRCLAKTAQWFLQKHADLVGDVVVRFDVVFVPWHAERPRIRYLVDAFRVG